MWDLIGSAAPRELPGHPDGVSEVAVSADGATVVSGGRDGVLRVCDLTGNRDPVSWVADDAVWAVALTTTSVLASDAAGRVHALQVRASGATVEDLPDGEGWAIERVRMATHSGTHLDAPYHYSTIMDRAITDGGTRAITIDEVPLEWCLQPSVKLDFRHLPDGYVVTAADVAAELERIDHQLSPLEIVVVNTAAGVRYGREDYVASGCGVGREATLYMLERGVRLTGTDAWSWDAPFMHTARRFAAEHDPSVIWEGHRAGRDIGYCHLEKLHNLESLPATGFQISCFPVKVHAASAGWTRAVAVLDD